MATSTLDIPHAGSEVLREYRCVMSQFATGVVIVTSVVDKQPFGLACQSFSSLSLDPPLAAVSLSNTSHSWKRIRTTGFFGVSVLSAHQQDISRRFGVSHDAKFSEVNWHTGTTGAPLLTGALAHIECLVEAVHPAGDHEIAIGRVISLKRTTENTPLIYFQSSYTTLHSIPQEN